mmetsp:Transcript_100971/g.290413  ORF Transcript_100971/g.290413 Transcript_100971/m.290413 type:complete len:288 (-) Transcript_100971:1342-2205(-)
MAFAFSGIVRCFLECVAPVKHTAHAVPRLAHGRCQRRGNLCKSRLRKLVRQCAACAAMVRLREHTRKAATFARGRDGTGSDQCHNCYGRSNEQDPLPLVGRAHGDVCHFSPRQVGLRRLKHLSQPRRRVLFDARKQSLLMEQHGRDKDDQRKHATAKHASGDEQPEFAEGPHQRNEVDEEDERCHRNGQQLQGNDPVIIVEVVDRSYVWSIPLGALPNIMQLQEAVAAEADDNKCHQEARQAQLLDVDHDVREQYRHDEDKEHDHRQEQALKVYPRYEDGDRERSDR